MTITNLSHTSTFPKKPNNKHIHHLPWFFSPESPCPSSCRRFSSRHPRSSGRRGRVLAEDRSEYPRSPRRASCRSLSGNSMLYARIYSPVEQHLVEPEFDQSTAGIQIKPIFHSNSIFQIYLKSIY